MKKNKYCVVDSVYTLTLYLLLIDVNVENTCFIVSDGIPKDIRDKLVNKVYISSHQLSNFRTVRNFFSAIRFLFSKYFRVIMSDKNKIIYGQDHLFFSFLFVRFGMYIIEDGTGNYNPIKMNPKNVFKIILSGGRFFGLNKYTKTIYLTRIKPLPENLDISKVIDVNIEKHWNDLGSGQQIKIISVLGGEDINLCSKIDTVILTQPFSEDGVMSEEEKQQLYKNMCSRYIGNIAIKPHPRDNTDYSKLGCIRVLNKNIPSQILFLFFEPKIIASCFSTGTLSKFKSADIHVYGTELSNKLVKRYGHISGNMY